jgi:hypothetical protein
MIFCQVSPSIQLSKDDFRQNFSSCFYEQREAFPLVKSMDNQSYLARLRLVVTLLFSFLSMFLKLSPLPLTVSYASGAF